MMNALLFGLSLASAASAQMAVAVNGFNMVSYAGGAPSYAPQTVRDIESLLSKSVSMAMISAVKVYVLWRNTYVAMTYLKLYGCRM